MRVILPKGKGLVDPDYGPLFFLAGPVLGGDDWQRTCYEEIRRHIHCFYAAIPCPYSRSHPLHDFQVPYTDRFDEIVAWERYYLNRAAKEGCLIFWLPRESKINPRPGGDYGRDTRGEIGEWRAHMMYNSSLRVVVGAEEGFSGLDEVQENFDLALGPNFLIHPTLYETVRAAIKKVKSEG